jgi:hypothetical protein
MLTLENLVQVQHCRVKGRASRAVSQMRYEDLGGCAVTQALAWQRVQMVDERDELLLGDGGEIGIAGREAAAALVGVFHRTFPPRRTGVAEPAPRADAIFQSPKAANSVPRSKVKLCRAKAGKGENVSMILSMIGLERRLGFLIITV